MKNSKITILVLSDSHGKKDFILNLTNNPKYDYVFYLGDGIDRDLGTLIYDPRLKCVKGNCDNCFSDFPLGETVYLENCKIFLTHGHEYQAKYGNELLLKLAIDNKYNIVCFGHTHKQGHYIFNNIHLINPGALKNGDYAEIIIDENKIDVIFNKILI
ncbi:MAG: YfcE family phosphodiesterase [Clostridia bacterium]|nr:YfcE family phosphodiesterase [Clostridia bacterium]